MKYVLLVLLYKSNSGCVVFSCSKYCACWLEWNVRPCYLVWKWKYNAGTELFPVVLFELWSVKMSRKSCMCVMISVSTWWSCYCSCTYYYYYDYFSLCVPGASCWCTCMFVCGWDWSDRGILSICAWQHWTCCSLPRANMEWRYSRRSSLLEDTAEHEHYSQSSKN